MLAYRINILCCGTSYSRVTSKMQRCLKRNQGIWKNNWQLKKMKVISPFYWQWSPTSCTLVSCHMLFMTKHSLYLINFQCTWQQGLIKLFPILNSRNTTTWQEYPQLKYNVATNSKNDQRQIKNNNTTTYPQSLTFSWGSLFPLFSDQTESWIPEQPSQPLSYGNK